MLKVRLSASATAQDNTDVAALRFYEDADLDNVIDNPGAPLGGGSAVYSAADRSYTRSGMTLHLDPGQSKNVLVTVDIRPVPTIGRTIVTEGASVSYVGTNAAVTTYTPFTSSAFTVSPDATPPAAVEDFNARHGENGQSTLTWTNPPDGDLQEVKVLRRTDVYPSGANDNIALTVYDNPAPVPSAPVTYPSAGLANGTTYYYAVFGVRT